MRVTRRQLTFGGLGLLASRTGSEPRGRGLVRLGGCHGRVGVVREGATKDERPGGGPRFRLPHEEAPFWCCSPAWDRP